VIMLFSIVYFQDSFVNIVTITFTALIFIELLNVFSSVTKVKKFMIYSVVGTILIYIGSIVFFRNYFNTSVITPIFLLKVFVITILCWAPLHLCKIIVERIDPSEEQKIRQKN
jgi:phospholipid-translocating ATPase